MENSIGEHLTYFKVENFKCFNSIELNDIGLINIITGDNNVGKSSLLEALLFNENIAVFNEDLGMILFDKGFSPKEDKSNAGPKRYNYFKSFINNASQKKELKYQFSNVGFESTILTQEINIYQNLLPDDIADSPFITKLYAMDDSIITSKVNYKSSNIPEINVTPYLSDQILYEDLVDFYENTLQKDFNLKTKFLNFLNEFVDGAINIEVRTARDEFKEAHLVIYTNKNSQPIPLNQYGQGTVKMLKIFMAIISFGGYRLMLDEIDNGIHYTRIEQYIKRIISLARENNTQLFISTHSKECLQAIEKAFESESLKDNQDLMRCYSLNKIKDGSIKAFKYNYDEFESVLGSDSDIRGGE